MNFFRSLAHSLNECWSDREETGTELETDKDLEKQAAEEHIRAGYKLSACAGRGKIKDV
jgi:hypothetical protein